MTNRILLHSALVLSILMVLFFVQSPEGRSPAGSASVTPTIEILPLPAIEAKSALAMDLLTGEKLYVKNAGSLLPLASITKIVSLLAVMDIAEFAETVEISQSAVLTPEPSSLVVGERLKVRDLMAVAMVESSNDAVAALVEYTAAKSGIPQEASKNWFLGLMRQRAESLGAPDMIFYDFVGLDVDETLAGAYGSARDIMEIVKKNKTSVLWQFGFLREVISEEGIVHKLTPTNKLDQELTLLVGAKTGFTDIAGGNLLVIVERPLGHPIGIVVLGSSEESRFSDVKAILDWIKEVR